MAKESATIKRTTSSMQTLLFNVTDGGELTLGGSGSGQLVIDGGYDGKNESIKSDHALVGGLANKAGSKCRINLLSNCTLQNNYNYTTESVSNNNCFFGGGVCFVSGVALSSDSGLYIDGATIQNCYAKFGGGVYFASVTDCKGYDGAVNYEDATFVFSNGVIKSNESWNNGGGVYLFKGKFLLDGGTISSNIANYTSPVQSGGGGGIFVKSGATSLLRSGSIETNTANNSYGGGVCFTGTSYVGVLVLSEGEINIYGNETTIDNGGNTIYGDYGFYIENFGVDKEIDTSDHDSDIYGGFI